MAANLNLQTIALANQAMQLIEQAADLKAQIDRFVTNWVQLDATAQLNAMPTCAVNTDGTLGMADTTPNTGHPIDTRVVTSLARAQSAFAIGSAENRLADLSSLMAGNAVGAQASWPSILANMSV